MISIEGESEKCLIVCNTSKGLSHLTIKAYRIDLKNFCAYINKKIRLTGNNLLNILIAYINVISPKVQKNCLH